MLKLNTYKSKEGLFIADTVFDYSGRRQTCWATDTYRFNGLTGKEIKYTHHKAWVFLLHQEELKTIEKRVSGKAINYRYEIKEDQKLPEGLDLPKVLSIEEVDACYDDEEYEWYWNNKECPWYGFERFYKRVYDMSPDTWEEIEFEVEHLGDITKTDAECIKDVKYEVYRTRWKHEGTVNLSLRDIATYKELDEMLYSDLVLHNRPCEIHPDIAFKIIRFHIEQNLDREQARIDSNYDFCFSVNKRINIKPYTFKTEVKKKNGGSYVKPRFNTKQISFKEEQIFNMAPRAYQKYNIIRGFKGKNLRELRDNIKDYLDQLMKTLNTPLNECECCKGFGVVLEKGEA